MPGSSAPLAIPDAVRAKARAHGAEAWLRALPALLADLQADWGLALGRAYGGGTEAYVAEAVRADGTPAVLKLLIPRDGDAARHEIAVLRHVAGEGCAALYKADESRGALLLERLGPSMHDLHIPFAERLPILCDSARRVWRPAADLGLPTGAEKGRWLTGFIERTWEALGRPCSERAVDHARACARRRVAAHRDERARLVHGDVHQWNALRAETGYKLVDPDGLLAEPEYDLGILMREDPEPLMTGVPRDRARWLAARTGLDAEAIWEWGAIERVSTGLLCTQIGLQPVGAAMLAAAERAARAG